MNRQRYLIMYDISDSHRAGKARRLIRSFAVGCQKSVFDCLIRPEELRDLIRELEDVIDPHEDRVQIFSIDPKLKLTAVGPNSRSADGPFMIV